MKKIVIASVLSAVVALATGGGAGWAVYSFMNKSSATASGQTEEEDSVHEEESNAIFVSLPETIVTLHDNHSVDHYMLAELVMVVAEDKDAEKIKKDEPLYQSIMVDRLSSMKYEEIRALKISEIKQVVLDVLQQELTRRKITLPYKDILVKKVVFQ